MAPRTNVRPHPGSEAEMADGDKRQLRTNETIVAAATPTPDRYELARRRIGTMLDNKWRLDDLLGMGGMATVYRATHRNGAKAAIKLLPFSVASGADLCQRLLREGAMANRIGHPAVVRVLDDHVDYEREHAYIVMELLEGETTRQRVERAGPFEALQAVDLCLELCDCLRAAHAAKTIHRDIKPDNLFLTKSGLKVLDFGIARALDGNSTLTQTGTSLGTPAYMSPEQARGKKSELSHKTDLYSIGATLLYLVSAETMHTGESAMELMVRVAWTPPPPAKLVCPKLPDSLAEVIDRCCAFDPADRYPDVQAVIDALRMIRQHLTSSPPPPLPRSLAPPVLDLASGAETVSGEPATAFTQSAPGGPFDPDTTVTARPAATRPRPLKRMLALTGVLLSVIGAGWFWLSPRHEDPSDAIAGQPLPLPTAAADQRAPELSKPAQASDQTTAADALDVQDLPEEPAPEASAVIPDGEGLPKSPTKRPARTKSSKPQSPRRAATSARPKPAPAPTGKPKPRPSLDYRGLITSP